MPSLIEYPQDDACLLYLVRHGATPHNLQRPPRLQGSGVNESLSDLGREHAERVAGALADRPIAAVYSSPMRRAVETATAIAGRHSLPISRLERLVEVNVGRWEGRTWDEIRADDAGAHARFLANPAEHGYPGGETMASVIDRTRETLSAVMRDHIGQEVVAVAHSVVNRSYLGSLLGLTPDKGYQIPQQNCSINVLRWKAGKAKVLTVNAITHLL